ncbi:MAG: hypothetical protein PHS04_11645 [Tissierellia bacterium]|nr:hypothetical protein [Tissierellia bacterium]
MLNGLEQSCSASNIGIYSFIQFALLGELKKATESIKGQRRHNAEGTLLKYFTDMGINGDYLDINTSEEDQAWRRFTRMMIDDNMLIYQSLEAFRIYNEISEIYYSLEDDTVEFFILIDKEEYDFNFMHELFSIERIVKKMWDGKYLDFHYVPTNYIDRSILYGYHIGFKRG